MVGLPIEIYGKFNSMFREINLAVAIVNSVFYITIYRSEFNMDMVLGLSDGVRLKLGQALTDLGVYEENMGFLPVDTHQ